MPGHGRGCGEKPPHRSGDRSRPDSYRQAQIVSAGNGRDFPQKGNGDVSETLGFIPGSAESPAGAAPSCGSCGSVGGWDGCCALLCCLLTCGFYGSPRPCLPPSESSTDPAPAELESKDPVTNGPGPAHLNKYDSFRYEDVQLAGRRVVYPVSSGPAPTRSNPTSGGDGIRRAEPPRPTSTFQRHDLDVDDVGERGTDVDSLINRKLLELFTEHQIEQLARCTSDHSFSRKTNDICELICSIAEDCNLEKKEAEWRLAREVIRISTRKKKRDRSGVSREAIHRTSGRRDGTLSDSGNASMDTFTYSNETEPEVKVSECTSSDELARQLRRHSGRGSSSTSPTTGSPYQNETETDSSGVPLLRFSRA